MKTVKDYQVVACTVAVCLFVIWVMFKIDQHNTEDKPRYAKHAEAFKFKSGDLCVVTDFKDTVLISRPDYITEQGTIKDYYVIHKNGNGTLREMSLPEGCLTLIKHK